MKGVSATTTPLTWRNAALTVSALALGYGTAWTGYTFYTRKVQVRFGTPLRRRTMEWTDADGGVLCHIDGYGLQWADMPSGSALDTDEVVRQRIQMAVDHAKRPMCAICLSDEVILPREP